MEFVVRAALIGIGATAVMDLWAAFLKRFFGVPALDYGLVGRWFGHLPRGRFVHDSIAQRRGFVASSLSAGLPTT